MNQSNHLHTISDTPVKLANVDLWQALDSVIQTHDIHWHWVRGHAGNKNNERVDRLARKALKVYLKER